MTISTIFIKTCLHWLNLTEKTPKYLKVFKSRFISLLKSFQTVIDSSRLMVTIQYHIILNTFNRQSTRKIQDNFLCVINFDMHVFSNFDTICEPGLRSEPFFAWLSQILFFSIGTSLFDLQLL